MISHIEKLQENSLSLKDVLSKRRNTGKLCVQNIQDISIMKEFARAGRIDDWKGHLAVMENCWIFLIFSENAKLYLQKMAELETGYP